MQLDRLIEFETVVHPMIVAMIRPMAVPSFWLDAMPLSGDKIWVNEIVILRYSILIADCIQFSNLKIGSGI